tara:strand:+ start:7660 stop:7899 length:240 start_codon:yes stop_codon:yes gene_type:complete
MNTAIKMEEKIFTVRGATKKAYEEMPVKFSALTLCLTVRKNLKKMTMDGSILRRLRELRADGVCTYRVVDPANAIYSKI